MTEQHHSDRPLPLRAYIALALTVVFFSGALSGVPGALGCLDFTTVSGSFGHIAGEFTFLGKGGGGARHGFLFALSLVPGIMLALGVVEMAERMQALHAAQKLLTPLMKPLLGLPGAAMTKDLHDKGLITEKEKPCSRPSSFPRPRPSRCTSAWASPFFRSLPCRTFCPSA